MSCSPLSEPLVLATAKEYLSHDTESGYAVVDAQFSQPTWGEAEISEGVRRRLRPINSLALKNGYPDALIAPPSSDAYRGTRSEATDSIPLAVLEAKGEKTSSNRNSGRIAISQAHDHLEEVNVGYAALPASIVTNREHALARELNVGLLVVDEAGAKLVEKPRVVGSNSSDTTDTIRFHARLGGVAVESLKKNHPKNAIGYALAVLFDDDTDAVFKDYVIQSVDDARLDATALGLIVGSLRRGQLTSLGQEAVRTISYHHGGVVSALEAIQKLRGSSARFIDELPVMGTVARQVLLTYPPTRVLVNTLDNLAREGDQEPTLALLAKTIAQERPELALDLFVSPGDRDYVLKDTGNEGEIDSTKFDEGFVYSTHTTFQYKALLYHVGLLTERGHDTKGELDPQSAVWALEDALIH